MIKKQLLVIRKKTIYIDSFKKRKKEKRKKVDSIKDFIIMKYKFSEKNKLIFLSDRFFFSKKY